MAPRHLLAFWSDVTRGRRAGRWGRRVWGAVLLALCAVALVYAFWWRSRPPELPAIVLTEKQHQAGLAASSAETTATVHGAAEMPMHAETVVDPRLAGSPAAAELNAAGGTAQHDVETLHLLLRQYLRHLGGHQGLPLGNDTDLARALSGHNPMKLVVLPISHPAMRRDGRLCDRWGTPYFIHPRGAGAYEIRSAGPDHKLFTEDDAVTGSGEGMLGRL